MKTKPILIRQLKIDPDRHKTISIVGAGGKSSMMDRLRRELVALGYSVIVTTSTHIAYDPDEPFAADGDAEKIKDLIGRHGYAVIGTVEKKPDSNIVKLKSVGEDKLSYLSGLCDVMLIEADGARGNYIKVPADWEPVIYPRTDLVIGIVSAVSIGKKIEDIAYRPEVTAAFLGKKPEELIDTEDILRIASSEAGLQKYVGGRDFRFFLNAIDEFAAEPGEVYSLMEQLNTDFGIEAHCGSLQHLDDMGVVIQAAGLGKRFGSNKLEAVIDGKPMYRHILDEMAEVFGYEGITFVTSHKSIADDVSNTGARVVINDHPEDGISSSMRLGLMENLKRGSCMFAVADQPNISSVTIRALVNGYMESDKLMASVVNDKGEFANPCIFSAAYYDSLLDIRGDRGGKSVIKGNPDDVYTYAPKADSELEDIDTIDDYRNLLQS